jgi:general secretion pathway protein K
MRFAFPTGEAVVEVIPETSKLNVNKAPPEAFLALLTALGADPARAQAITAAILHWRGGGLGPLDQYYLSLGPTFRPRHASVQDVEELANAQGMTPELFHGNYVRDHQGRMVRLGAFKDCVSVWGSTGPFDVNTVEPAVMAAVGIHPEIAQRIVEYRRLQPVMNDRQMAEIAMIAGPGAGRLRRAGGNSIYTLRATARLRLPNGRLGDLSRTVAATVKFVPPTNNPPHYVLRWDETGTSEVSQW